MAYVKQTWVDGTSIVDADKLNHIEDGIYNANLNSDYSTSEVDTGKTWIDGKPIYRKVLNFGALPNTTTKSVAHGISNLDKLIYMRGYAYNPTENVSYTLPHAHPSNVAFQVSLYRNAGNIIVGTGFDRTAFTDCYIILEYTKTS